MSGSESDSSHRPVAWMELPKAFVDELLHELLPFCAGRGSVPLAAAERLVGRAGRVAYVVPLAKPFVASLYGALAGSKAARREAPPGEVAVVRFLCGARWLAALLKQEGEAYVPLRRVVHASKPPPASTSGWILQVDASTTGAGGVMRFGTRIVEYFDCQWSEDTAGHLGAAPGDPKWQSFWELLALVFALVLWGKHFTETTAAVLGDNTAALGDAVNLKGKGPMLAVARELAWRQGKFGWLFEAGHVASESNSVPDALSRRSESRTTFPAAALRSASRIEAPAA